MANRDERILIVDDDAASRNVVRHALMTCGYDIIEAEDALSALDMIKMDPPNLILTDVMMPGMSGFELCHQLKSATLWSHIPVMFLTAVCELPDEPSKFEMADDYIVKPFDVPELQMRVDILLRIQRDRYCMLPGADGSPSVQSLQSQIELEKNKVLQQLYIALHHEIRNPLTGILIGAQILTNHISKQSPERKILDEMENCAKRIRQTMDMLGSMRRIVVDEYVHGTQMINIKKSAEF